MGKTAQSLSSRSSGPNKGHGQIHKDLSNKWRGGLCRWGICGGGLETRRLREYVTMEMRFCLEMGEICSLPGQEGRELGTRPPRNAHETLVGK